MEENCSRSNNRGSTWGILKITPIPANTRAAPPDDLGNGLISVHKIRSILLQFSWRRGFRPATQTVGKDSRGRGFEGFFRKTLSEPLTFFRFLRCLVLSTQHLFFN